MKRLLFISLLLWPGFLTQGQVFPQDSVSINSDGIQLGGMLMYPENISSAQKVPVVLIIQGSGPTDKDGNSNLSTGKNNALLYVAEALAAEGIASLRYDKRGMGMSGKSPLIEATLSFDHFIKDAQNWLKYLSSHSQFSKIGVLGHSQGALIASIVSQNKEVSALASVAGAGQSIDQIILKQIKDNPFNPAQVYNEAETIFKKLGNGLKVDSIPPYLNSLFRKDIQPFMSSWMKYDPGVELKKVKNAIWIVNGTTDIQVSVEDAASLKAAQPKANLTIIEGMNHVLKTADEDRNANMATYSNPDLPLHQEFVKLLKAFFTKELL